MSENNFYSLKVIEKQLVTDDAVCLSLAVPNELKDKFNFVQGQYITFKSIVNGKEIRRSYSLCSSINEKHLKVGIKKIDNGLFSNFACNDLLVGSAIEVMPPKGNFFTPIKQGQKKHYMLIAVGSGITPMLSIMKSIFETEQESTITLVYGNRRSSTIMFKEELGFIKNKYLSRFNWINVLSREEQDADVLFGRINNKKGGELASKKLIDIINTDEFFLCGPESMISEVSRGLRKEGVSEENIHYELFFASAADAKASVKKHHARAEKYGSKHCNVSVNIDGRSIHFDLTSDGENILDAAMNNGADLPYSCKGGVCATCKAKVLEGEVEMDLNHSLTEKEVANGMILTCQAHPISDKLIVDFDSKN